ncbi:flavin reductase family protein [Streptomyces iranensis]|uniref:flavin reductase family protein n=1 Tax=Streptomyces iranensis TaxID=576784 RepID=UPI0039B754AE
MTTEAVRSRPVPGAALRQALRSWPTGVAVLFLGTGADQTGATVNSLAPVSLDPAVVSVALRSGSRTAQQACPGAPVVLSILGQHNATAARLCADPGRPLTHDPAVVELASDGTARAIREALSTLTGHVRAVHTVGDHELLLIDVDDVVPGSPGSPLVFVHSQFHADPVPLA